LERHHRVKIEWELVEEKEKNRKTQPTLSLNSLIETRILRSPSAGLNTQDQDSMRVYDAFNLIRERTLNGLIGVFGSDEYHSTRPGDHDEVVRKRIAKDYWKDHELEYLSYLSDRRRLAVDRNPHKRGLQHEALEYFNSSTRSRLNSSGLSRLGNLMGKTPKFAEGL
jgi:hypothetical protein